MQKDAVYERIGTKIRDVRKERGLNQEDIARALDLTRTAITNIETGRQTIQVHQLLLIAEALGVPTQKLIDVDVDEVRKSSSNVTASDLPENLASIVSKFQSRLPS